MQIILGLHFKASLKTLHFLSFARPAEPFGRGEELNLPAGKGRGEVKETK